MYSMNQQEALLSDLAKTLQGCGVLDAKLTEFSQEEGGRMQLEVGPWCVIVDHVTPWLESCDTIQDDEKPYYQALGPDESLAFCTEFVGELVIWLLAYSPYAIAVKDRKFMEYLL
jgi:hypothetical protein